jgi:hypothetical protein
VTNLDSTLHDLNQTEAKPPAMLGGHRDGGLAMVPGLGASVVRAAAVVLVLLVGLLWLLGLSRGREQRAYIPRDSLTEPAPSCMRCHRPDCGSCSEEAK